MHTLSKIVHKEIEPVMKTVLFTGKFGFICFVEGEEDLLCESEADLNCSSATA
jgi:hypothetical protein